MTGVNTGDPLVLTNADGLESYGLKTGDKGWANSVTTVPGHGTYVFFMGDETKTTHVIEAHRVSLDDDRVGLELDQSTIYKGQL